MHKIIIFDNNVEFISKIITLLYPVANAKIKTICTKVTKENLKEVLNETDVLIMSEINYLKYFSLFNVENRIIIFTKDNIRVKANNNILYLSDNISLESAGKNIYTFLALTPMETLEEKVKKLLLSLKFDFKYVGTTYLLESILLCLDNSDLYLCENLTKNVFSVLAKKYHSTPNNIKWSISRTITHLYDAANITDKQKLSKFFKLEPTQKPTTKLIICTILNKIIKH